MSTVNDMTIPEKIEFLEPDAHEQAKRRDNHVNATNKPIAEAEGLCYVGGFDKFRELFCPQLGKSQAYVRFAIAAGKTTLVEHRARERERKRAKHRRAIAPGDEALLGFSARVMDLIRATRGRKAERFAKTSVPADDLARLGELLTDIANLKKPATVKSAPTTALPDKGTVSLGQPAANAERAAPEASAGLGA